MARIRLVALFSFSFLLAACASTPTEYLRLQAEGMPLPSKPLTTGQAVLLVDHVQMPASLDRLYLTRGKGKNGVEVSNHTRWIAPLGGMMQRVLAEDLRRQAGKYTVLLAGSPVPSGSRPLQLRVQVQEFLPEENGIVVLDADYFLLNGEGTLQYAGHFRYQSTVQTAAAAEAQAMSAAVAALARDVGRHIPET
ncbi:MAG: membrane integrity-associated transporter subunit PqiC [Acidithiobacillus sp.]|nr:membrane integrity-associated transporter subunit PqiC [Acidithiobacillus sp.]